MNAYFLCHEPGNLVHFTDAEITVVQALFPEFQVTQLKPATKTPNTFYIQIDSEVSVRVS